MPKQHRRPDCRPYEWPLRWYPGLQTFQIVLRPLRWAPQLSNDLYDDLRAPRPSRHVVCDLPKNRKRNVKGRKAPRALWECAILNDTSAPMSKQFIWIADGDGSSALLNLEAETITFMLNPSFWFFSLSPRSVYDCWNFYFSEKRIRFLSIVIFPITVYDCWK